MLPEHVNKLFLKNAIPEELLSFAFLCEEGSDR